MKLKKLFSIFLIITFILLLFSFTIVATAEEETLEMPELSFESSCLSWPFSDIVAEGHVYTPNDTAVYVFEKREGILFNPSQYDTISDAIFPQNTRLSSATRKYNCHSYAWYSQSTSNNKWWMNDPSAYYTDGSYTEVFSPQAGDIICYFDDNNNPVHSGIVVQVLGYADNSICGTASKYIVESKWGEYGLYQHRGDRCPYPYTEYMGSYPIATNVKFYRRYCNHSFYYTWMSVENHKIECHYCDYYEVTGHVVGMNMQPNALDIYICSLCGGRANVGPIIYPPGELQSV